MKKKKIENKCAHYWIYKWSDIDDETLRTRRCKHCGETSEHKTNQGLDSWNGMTVSSWKGLSPVQRMGSKGGRPKGSRK
tara:strand:- start:140 stop:376 length:237 start_codon:yes stop_codon:yes gene_type:complete